MAYWARVCARLGMGLARFPALRSACAARYYAGVLGSLAVGGLFLSRHRGSGTRFGPCAVHAAQDEEEEEEKKKKKAVKESAFSVQSARRLRFAQFCSVEYEEEPYMTPRDFLFSVTLENVDRKCNRLVRSLACFPSNLLAENISEQRSVQDVDKMLSAATAAKAGPTLFRTLGDSGLISYTEYLFLLTILTKPHTGFHIAFKMLDVDGNEHVDKKEFLKVRMYTSINAQHASRLFMEDLQAEVQEMEFLQFSKGMDTMRREDFAEWLLHYTNEEDNDIYLENMKKRIPAGQSITFDEFKSFCLFTNNLEDFALSVKMISEANRPIGMAEFRRAVKIATGNDLSESVLDTVFKIFDLDGDNCLSHKEFIQVMKDRIHRGLKVHPEHGIPGYWRCVKRETL
ncbi:calcium uptake protein 2, mitochondrial-like, partial [Scleropages formosus]